ncbi:MAG: pilin [Patescibacteria group bacterium]|nr:pilin [Patescibacteria group bacterium]
MKKTISKIHPRLITIIAGLAWAKNSLGEQPEAPNKYNQLVPCGPGTDTPCELCHILVMASNIFSFFLKISLGFAILFAGVAGVLYITSAGNESMMTAAKNAIKYAALGFALCLLAWLLINILAGSLGYTENWWSPNIECD